MIISIESEKAFYELFHSLNKDLLVLTMFQMLGKIPVSVTFVLP